MDKRAEKISKKWIEQTRELLRVYQDGTDVPDPDRTGESGPKFRYPEWLIIFIFVLSAKMKIKTCVQIHKMTNESSVAAVWSRKAGWWPACYLRHWSLFISPDFVSNLFDESKLAPLLLFAEHVPFFR